MKPTDCIAIAAICVSLLTVAFNLFLDRKKRIADKRAEAYIDFLKHISNASNPAKSQLDDNNFDAQILEAKIRILLYGSASVISSLQELQRHQIISSSPKSLVAFVRLIQAMQKDCSGVHSTIEEILLPTVFVKGIPSETLTEIRRELGRGGRR